MKKDKPLIIANREFKSRLIIGTGKYSSYKLNAQCAKEAEVDIVTIAIRRVNLFNKTEENIQDYISPNEFTYLPNTAGCFTAKDALRTLRLAREQGGWNLVKLEILSDKDTLYPDMQATYEACKELISDGFDVMVYCTDDLVYAQKLRDLGVAAIMPLAAPIGSGLGIQNPLNISFIVEKIDIPVIIDAGVGTASDAVRAMELGCDGVLLNSSIAYAKNPLLMARAMKNAVICGRDAYLSGRMEPKKYAVASSPFENRIG